MVKQKLTVHYEMLFKERKKYVNQRVTNYKRSVKNSFFLIKT